MTQLGPDGRKLCPRCKTVKEAAAFGVSRRLPDGLACWCKACKRAQYKARYHSGDGTRERYLKRARERKANDPEARAAYAKRNAEWYAEQKAADPTFMETRRKRDRAWRVGHPEATKIKARKNMERILSDPERHAALNERHNKYMRERWANDPEFKAKLSDYHARRRAIKNGNGGSYELEDWHTMCDLAGNRCVACGKKRKLTVDHVLPIIMGGDSYLMNLQPLCGSCNKSKGPKYIDYRPAHIHQWLDVLTD